MRILLIVAVIWIFHQGCKMSTDKTNTAKGPDEYKLDTTDIIEVLRNNPSPDLLFPELFHEVQIRALFPDSKTFADAVPKSSIEVINSAYKDLNQELDDSNLRHLISQNFDIPQSPIINIVQEKNTEKHIQSLWSILTKSPQTINRGSSLLALPGSYVVPGGRFQEIYYWDSYFTMLGLAEAKRFDLITAMIDNFAFLINQYGHIPNGNRTYFLSRSQPPFLALMVDLLAKEQGDSIYVKYLPVLEKEYLFWMNGRDSIENAYGGYRRVVKTSRGAIMNRYWDDSPRPRPEAYKEDVALAARFNGDKKEIYRQIRAAAESGWDFSTRWTAGSTDLINTHTTFYIPVDLNSLLYFLEKTLSKAFRLVNKDDLSERYAELAELRKANINEYCWVPSAKYYMDYNWRRSVFSSEATAAGAFPLFFMLATKEQAEGAAKFIELLLLKEGGIVTTVVHSGQQWDEPNGWAPLQWITYQGLKNYGYHELAQKIAKRWTSRNEAVFAQTGKMMEKYNVVDTSLLAGGGEYPTQDGFGWTNGVYIKLLSELNQK